MHADGNDRHRSAIAILCRIVDELIVERDVPERGQFVAVVGLDDLFETGVRQHPVADHDAETACVEVSLVRAADIVDSAGYAERVVRASPWFSGLGEPDRN